MPIKQSITYTVKCDREGCDADIDRDGYEPVFNDPQQAIDEATEYEWDADDQRVLCPEHARPFCPHCHRFVDQASKDDDGEDCCADCLPHHTSSVAV